MKNELTIDRNGYRFSTRTNKYRKQVFTDYDELCAYAYSFLHSTALYKVEIFAINPKPKQFDINYVCPNDLILNEISKKLMNCRKEDFSSLLYKCLINSMIINIVGGLNQYDYRRVGFLITPRILKHPVLHIVYTGNVTTAEYNANLF